MDFKLRTEKNLDALLSFAGCTSKGKNMLLRDIKRLMNAEDEQKEGGTAESPQSMPPGRVKNLSVISENDESTQSDNLAFEVRRQLVENEALLKRLA